MKIYITLILYFLLASCTHKLSLHDTNEVAERYPSNIQCRGLFKSNITLIKQSIDPNKIQSKDFVINLIESINPTRITFIKDAPTLAYKITSSRFEDIPQIIKQHLGDVDQTQYTSDYLEKNIGSVFALQMNGDKPDFYVIGKATYDTKYKLSTLEQVQNKNKKYFDKVSLEIGSLAGDNNTVAILKMAPVDMIKMSDIGYKKEDRITIESPWGEQTKPANQDAYLVFDAGKNMYYMVNTDANGLPISYVPKN